MYYLFFIHLIFINHLDGHHCPVLYRSYTHEHTCTHTHRHQEKHKTWTKNMNKTRKGHTTWELPIYALLRHTYSKLTLTTLLEKSCDFGTKWQVSKPFRGLLAPTLWHTVIVLLAFIELWWTEYRITSSDHRNVMVECPLEPGAHIT